MQKRAFLKGGLAALGGFGLMGAASAANPAAGNIPAAKDIKWDEEFDTIIVGSGVAATCAGNEALDQGLKKVIMVEKMPVYGGNSAITGFWINIPRSPEQLNARRHGRFARTLPQGHPQGRRRLQRPGARQGALLQRARRLQLSPGARLQVRAHALHPGRPIEDPFLGA